MSNQTKSNSKETFHHNHVRIHQCKHTQLNKARGKCAAKVFFFSYWWRRSSEIRQEQIDAVFIIRVVVVKMTKSARIWTKISFSLQSWLFDVYSVYPIIERKNASKTKSSSNLLLVTAHVLFFLSLSLFHFATWWCLNYGFSGLWSNVWVVNSVMKLSRFFRWGNIYVIFILWGIHVSSIDNSVTNMLLLFVHLIPPSVSYFAWKLDIYGMHGWRWLAQTAASTQIFIQN